MTTPPLQTSYGIAASYQNDVGLVSHPSVILFEDFSDYQTPSGIEEHMAESGTALEKGKRWHDLRVNQYGSLDTPGYILVDAGSIKSRSLKLTLPASTQELSMGFWQWLDKTIFTDAKIPLPNGIKTKEGGYDDLYLRYYQKFALGYDITGSNHCGPSLSSWYNKRPYGQASPGHKANGYNKMLVANEFWRGDSKDTPPGKANFYVYHPKQGGIYGDHFFPTGHISVSEGPQSAAIPLSPDFVKCSDFTPELDRWYCLEFRVKLNTVIEEGEYNFTGDYIYGGDRGAVNVTKKPVYLHDGRITGWVDGQVIADFPNLVLRYTNDLKLDDCIFGLHAKNSTKDNTIWYGGIVLATEYIGPIPHPPLAQTQP